MSRREPAACAPAEPELGRWRAAARQVERGVPLARTPLLLLDLDRVRSQLALWRRCLPHVRPFYAMKANSLPAVLELLREAGSGFDAATRGELDLLRELGIGGEHIASTHPIRDGRDLAGVAGVRPSILVVQDVQEIEKLSARGIPCADYAPVLLVRVALPFSNLNKFGVRVLEPKIEPGRSTWAIAPEPLLEILRAARRAEAERGARFSGLGLAGHVGTNQHEVAPYRVMFALFRHLSDAAAEQGFELELFDLGGGFCDEMTARAHETTQETLLRELARAVDEVLTVRPRARFLAEPGRFLVADAAALLLGVKSVVRLHWRTLPDGAVVELDHLELHIDDGIYGSLMGQVHDDKRWELHPLRERARAEPTLPAHVWGATCDSYDRIEGLRDLPADLAAGERLIVPHAGAYTIATSTRFNRTAGTWVWAFEGDELRGWSGALLDELGRRVDGA